MDAVRGLRSDARRRRGALLEAAAAVFGKDGIDAPLETIAERAGVGRATLYRNFPDRPSLILAVLEHEFGIIEAKAGRLADEPGGLFMLLDEMSEMLIRAATLGDALRQAKLGGDAAARLQARIKSIFAGPVARAQAAGLVRRDLAAADAVLVVTMLAAGLRIGGAPANRRSRAATLLMEGLRVREGVDG